MYEKCGCSRISDIVGDPFMAPGYPNETHDAVFVQHGHFVQQV